MEKIYPELWKGIRAQLSEILSKDVFDRWIDVIATAGVDGNTLLLSVPNNFYQTWMDNHYLPLILTAAKALTGRDVGVRFVIDRSPRAESPPSEPRRPEKATPQRARRDTQGPSLNSKYTFDTFIVGPSNNLAHAAGMAVAQAPAKAYNPLFLYGGVGLGKTHLMQAIGHQVLTKSNISLMYLSSEQFVNEYIDALQNKKLVPFRRKFRNTDILLIDDIQFLAGKERMQEEFFHTFNALFENHKQIVITCDRPASEIPQLEQRLVSRFEWGLVTELETPDTETRIAILRRKNGELGGKLSDDIIQFIAENIRSNIRRLEGALIRAAAHQSITSQTLTVDILKHLLRDTLDQQLAKTFSVDEIQRKTAEFFEIRVTDLIGTRRPQSIVLPRQVAMYISRQLTQQSLPLLGQAFGRNHATVLYACRVIDDRMREDAGFRQTVQALTERIKA